jgi:hypothetical protein
MKFLSLTPNIKAMKHKVIGITIPTILRRMLEV